MMVSIRVKEMHRARSCLWPLRAWVVLNRNDVVGKYSMSGHRPGLIPVIAVTTLAVLLSLSHTCHAQSRPVANCTNGTANVTCAGNSSAAPATTAVMPTTATTTTAAPTPAPPTPAPTTAAPPTPQPTTACQRGRFECDDTMWRCVRGSSFNRCGCLAVYWQCLVDRACGPTAADATTCADRSSGLLCPDVDEASGLRVCPTDAGVVFDESGKGWIVALVFFSISCSWFLSTLLYVCLVRGWLRCPDGSLVFRGDPIVGAVVGHQSRKRSAGAGLKEGGGNHDPNATEELKHGGAEPPELILLSPEAMDRYRAYLRDRYREARERGETTEEEEPALLRASSQNARHADNLRRIDTEYDRKMQQELSELREAGDMDTLAKRALEVDAADREVDGHRARLAGALRREREALVRELSVGREAARGRLPSETVVDPERGVHSSPYHSYREDLAGGRVVLPRESPDRHGGLAAPASVARARRQDNFYGAYTGASYADPLDGPSALYSNAANPIAVLFDNLQRSARQPEARVESDPRDSVHRVGSWSRADSDLLAAGESVGGGAAAREPRVPPGPYGPSLGAAPMQRDGGHHRVLDVSEVPFASPVQSNAQHRPVGFPADALRRHLPEDNEGRDMSPRHGNVHPLMAFGRRTTPHAEL
jgi:hypothetical protein